MESNPRAGRKSRKLGSRRRHQMKELSDEDPPPAADTEQWPSHATEELQDFFRECGAEHKGFITREDLGKAKFSFLGSPEELQLIFDWMDPERKGSLTLKEFTSGLKNVFSSQTKIPGPRKRKTRTWIFSKEEPTSLQPLEEADPEERRWFLSFMEQLGADQLFVDQAEIWQLWKKLRQEEPHLVGNLEGFLAKMTSRLQETRAEKEALQMSLKKCDDDHHHEIQQLYEEMEQQIHSEKQRLQAVSDTQGLAYSSMMHQALEAKEREMQYLTEGQRELETQINLLKSEHHEVSVENQRLQETQRDLTGQLKQAQEHLQVTRGNVHLARGQVSWLVEEKTSDPPAVPKNTLDSQHLISFPEENPLPSLFEEGEWSQLLTNFTSPLPGNTTQVSWSPPPTPTSLQGHHTPRVVRQISITKSKSWQLNQESPSDPEVPPKSPPGPSAAPTIMSELKVTGEPKHEEMFQWDFQRVPSGEPAITTGGQADPVLGDSLPSQGLAKSGKRVGETDADEVGQGNGPISDMFSKGSSSEESLQTPGPSADVQANTWEVGPKETPHPGLHPPGLEQEVGSWENEVYTAGPDVPIKTPELVLIQESIPTREQEQEKMNTDGWEVETSQQNDASGQETVLRESTGPDVGEVPGEGSRSTESPEPDMGDIPGVGSRSTESPEPDVGEVPGDESRLTKSPGPDVENAPSQETGPTESPGPDIGNSHAQETSHIDSPRPDVDGVLSQENQILKSLELDVGKAPDQETQLIHLATMMQLPGAVTGNISEKESELIMSSRADSDNATGPEVGVLELARLDVGNVLCEEVGLLESTELERDNYPGQEIRLHQSPGLDVGVYPSYEDRILGSYQPGVGNGTELHQLIMRHAPDQESGFMTSPEVDAPSQETGLIGSPGPDGDDVPGQETRFMESWEIDIKDASGKEAQVLHSPGPGVGETPRQENVLMSSPRRDVAEATGQEAWMGLGDAALQEVRVIELCRGDVGNASDQRSGLIVELHVDDTPGQENGFIQSGETDTKDTSGQEGAILYSPGIYLGDVPGQGARHIESSESGVSDVAIQEAGLMNSSVIDLINSPGQEDKSMALPETEVGIATIQESKHIDSESGLNVGDTSGQETRLSESASANIGGAFLYSTGLDVEYALSQEARLIEPPRKVVDDATVQGPGVTELFKVVVGNTSNQESRLIRPPKVDVPSVETELVESTALEMRDASGQEARFRESWERHVGNNEIADITYSPDPDMSDSPAQEAGVVELYGLNVSETPIQETRVLASSETDVNDGLGRKVVISASYEAEVRNTSARDTEVMYSSWPGVSVATGQEAEIFHSPGPHMEDSPDQEAGLKGSSTLDLGGAPGQKGRFMESPEAGMDEGSSNQVEQIESFEADVRDTLGQEDGFRESCEIDEEDTFGLMEALVPGLGETPGQEGKFLESSEGNVDSGSSQVTEQTGSPGPDMRDAHGPDAGFRESYETDMEDALGKEVEYGPDGGDVVTGQGILVLETHEPGVNDISSPNEITGLVESYGPEVGDIPSQEIEIMPSPGSDGAEAFGQETKFVELCETVEGNTMIAEIMYSPVPHMSDSTDREAGVGEFHGLYVSETPIQEARVLASPERDVGDGPVQEVVITESYEVGVSNASAQDAEIIHSPRPGVSDSAGLEAEMVLSPGPYGRDSPDQEGVVTELHRPDVGNASDQEARFMPPTKPDVKDAASEETGFRESFEGVEGDIPSQEAEILHSPGPDVKDSPGQEAGLKKSLVLNLGGTPGQEGGFMESPVIGVDNEYNHQVGHTGSPGPGVKDALGQEDGFRESCEIDEEDTFGLMESTGLGETPGQEGKFLESSEGSVDNGSSQVTEQTWSPGSDMRDAPGPDSGCRESYETDMEDALGKEAEFGPDGSDVVTGQGILVLETHEPGVNDISSPNEITGFIESYGPEMDDILSQEVKKMHSPSSDGAEAFGQEAKFTELGEMIEGNAEIAEVMYSPTGDSPDQKAGVGEFHGLYVSETPIQEARVLASPERDVGDGPVQEVVITESYEVGVSNASAQDAEIIHSPRPGVSDSAGLEAEMVLSPGPYGRDSPDQEGVVTELHRPDVGNASDQEARFMPPTKPDVKDAASEETGFRESFEGVEGDIPSQEAEILHSPGPDVKDSSGQEAGLKKSSVLNLGGTPGQEGGFMESPEAGVDDGSSNQVEQIESLEADVRDTLGQEDGFRESCEIDEEDTFGLMEALVPGLGETPGQEGKFLLSPEKGVDDGSSQVTEQTGLPGPDMRDAHGPDAGFRESYETDMEDALGKEVKFGPDGGDVVTGQGILVLETHEPGVNDISSPNEITGLVESYGPEVGDIPSQEVETMPSPGSDGAKAFGQEAKFVELCEVVEGNTMIAEVMYSPVPDMRDSPGQEGGFMESPVAGVDNEYNHQVGHTGSPGPDVKDALGQEDDFREACEIDEEDTFGLMESTGLGETPGQEDKFLESSEGSVDNGSSQVTEQTWSPGPDMGDAPDQEAGCRESYETDMRVALGKEVEFCPDGGDVVAGQGILMPERHESDVSEVSSPGQIAGLIESYGPEMGNIPSKKAETMHLLGQEANFMELYETDVGDTKIAEVMYSSVPCMNDSPDQEASVMESPETGVSDAPGQEVVISESCEAGGRNASAQDTEILHLPQSGVNDSAGLETEMVHSPGPYLGDSPGQEGGVTELHRPNVGNASDQEARFMPLSEADVSDGAGQEAEILHSPDPQVEDSPGEEGGLKKSLVLNLGGTPGQESRFLELTEAGMDDGSCQQVGQIRSPGSNVKDAPDQETEILHSPSRDVGDYPHQGTYRLIDLSRPLVDILSDGEIQLPESPEPRLGDAPEEKSGNIESPRPDVLPVIPERGGLRDQNPEDLWRAEDKGLQRQAPEGSFFPKDSSGNTLDPQDSEQALSILVESGSQSGSKVLGGQITPLSLEPREENRSEVTKETKAEAAGASPGGRSPDPDYLFHVLFLGDSNVGKTSFLHLLHHDSFATGLTATVGMDYRIKNLVVDNRRFALQLWDTAGQERYHSITKQFLRKADGIVLMYDVTCPRSFTHVRYWLDCIQEAGPDDVVILLLGNKIDCVEERQVSTEAGQLLAKEIGVIFGECSAILGHNILEPIVTLARALQEQDSKLKHGVVELEKKEAKKKNSCCS